ncbi:cyclin dependent kinase inhibitor 1Bb [Gouania willdenowi]|uniref:cyclin dependent kinase inhibitor 1Bb n=1 Tax=Gouania willdenowi TaxID=441366 RepID=UPI001054926F|nr:cyclin-dependent kinase inhibitor 1B [Gouania willdenowi]
MSDVRLSNDSPTLGRTEPRVSEHPKPSACRNLFGSVDHDELKQDLKIHLRDLEQAASSKWGFDFGRHKPLSNGRLDWELVDCTEVPDFYREKGACPPGNNNVDLNGNHSCLLVALGESTELGKRPACPDTTVQNKRSHTIPDDCLRLSHSTEHTPRKRQT